jgi:hypothetical protein
MGTTKPIDALSQVLDLIVGDPEKHQRRIADLKAPETDAREPEAHARVAKADADQAIDLLAKQRAEIETAR